MFNFFRRKKLSDKEQYEIALIQAMAADGRVMSFYYDFTPRTEQGKAEYKKYFQPGRRWE